MHRNENALGYLVMYFSLRYPGMRERDIALGYSLSSNTTEALIESCQWNWPMAFKRAKYERESIFLFIIIITKIGEIYRNRETRHECIPTKNSHINKDRKTNILDLRTSNYGIICTEKCKNKIR